MPPTVTHAPELELDRGFVVATGIECSAPRIEGGHRQDELIKTGHWVRYAEDLALVASFGIRYLRYGVPFHVVAHDPALLDWRWTDSAFGALRDAGLEPIADLLHFGLPDDVAGVGDPALPARFAAFAAAFAERYPWVRWYTPVNEPLVTATFSARLGWWNERKADERSFVRALDNAARCAVEGMRVIRDRRPDAIFVQSDGCETYQAAHRKAVRPAAFLNERRFVGWDLTYGRRPGSAMRRWLLANGLSERRLAWFEEHGSSESCIVGHDYYAGNEWMVEADGRTRQARAAERRGYAAVAREYHAHFGLPFMLSETNFEGPATESWLARTWNDTLQLRLEGLPIRGYTWYGFVDHVDWNTALRVAAGTVNPCGLVDLDRRPHAWGETYRDVARAAARGEFRPLVGESPVALPEAVPGFVDGSGAGALGGATA
jgi:beta-glucosidase/6-phospho-beta-glucosidase/beta-galactosidase